MGMLAVDICTSEDGSKLASKPPSVSLETRLSRKPRPIRARHVRITKNPQYDS